MSMKKFSTLKQKWLKDPNVKAAYDEHALEFEVAEKMIAARLTAKLTQKEVAEKMGTTQSVVARLESGERLPALRTIERYAHALGKHVELRFSADL